MLRAATVISLLLLTATPALAHIVANPNKGESGAWFRTNLMVSHGCENDSGVNSDTIKITVEIPKNILIVKPQAKTGWKIDIIKHKLDKPIQGPHGKMITEVTDKISWTGNLPDAYSMSSAEHEITGNNRDRLLANITGMRQRHSQLERFADENGRNGTYADEA